MRGAIDLSPAAARDVSEDQENELWTRARAVGVLVTVVALEHGGFLATVVGLAGQTTAVHLSAYRAAVLALAKAADKLAALNGVTQVTIA